MDVEELREYCVAKQATTEGFPFDEVSLVVKVMDKMFVILSLDGDGYMNLKCDPERAIELRAEYPAEITPGYHMNKKHWNSVYFNGSLSDKMLKELIDHSYDLVVASLPKKKREMLG